MSFFRARTYGVRHCVLPSLALLLLCAVGARGEVRLPRLISDGMVLQRDSPLRIWGSAAPGERVTVRFNGQVKEVMAGSSGKWRVELAPMPAGGPYVMTVNEVHIHDVVLGDVWICSGQSNMELPMERVKERYPEEIAHSANPMIRQFSAGMQYDFSSPREDFEKGSWQAADPTSVLSFSAVAYFFAWNLYEKYHIPIGLVKVAVGGSPAEAWLSAEALKAFPEEAAIKKKYADAGYRERIKTAEDSTTREWFRQLRHADSGWSEGPTWADMQYNDSKWKEVDIPGLHLSRGAGWFRRHFDVPVQWTTLRTRLMLGRIIDADSVYINGVFVGTTGYQYPPRRYEVPAGLLKEKDNVIVVRVINSSGTGGFVPDKPYWLGVGSERLRLDGKWKFRKGAAATPLAPTTFFPYQPGGLYNGMIAPLLAYGINGVIWYQGESNISRASAYQRVFTALIKDWRKSWNAPFLFVQLPNYGEARLIDTASEWAVLREAQLQTLAMPNTAMAVTIDIGEWNDLHPLDKSDVGKRLALAAQGVTGPVYKSMRIAGSKVVITLTGAGLVARGGKPKGFVIAGKDGRWAAAEGEIRGSSVILQSRRVPRPVAVRYAWADNPAGANLYDTQGLPASPFRTDSE